MTTRSSHYVWLIGYPTESIKGARLPCGRDVMTNFIYFHLSQKHTINESAVLVYKQIVPFWEKSRLPIKQKQHILQKIKDLYGKQVSLMKNRKRNNSKDQDNQRIYCESLEKLFDISHADSETLIKNEEDRQFLRLQQISRKGCIGPLDTNLAKREARSFERQTKFAKRVAVATLASISTTKSFITDEFPTDLEYSNDESQSPQKSETTKDKDTDTDVYFKNIGDDESKKNLKLPTPKRRSIVTSKVAAVLDRSNISIRKSTMVMASIINEEGGSGSGCYCSSSETLSSNESLKSVILSKSTVHRERQRLRSETAELIKTQFKASMSVVHWDGKLLPDVSINETNKAHRLPVLLSSLHDGSTKLLGVPKLSSGTGEAAATAVFQLLLSWKSDSEVIGMCFDTTAVNSGKFSGACTLLEKKMGRNLLWMACRHHIFEVLLSDVFFVCLGPSTGPDIAIFSRFKENWSNLNHHQPKNPKVPIIVASDKLKKFISNQIEIASKHFPRSDYKELLNLSALIIGMDVKVTVQKPGALHRARWMAKAIYSLKMELLFDGNELVMKLTPSEFQGLQRFNRFVIFIYIQSWFTSQSAIDAPINDILLIQRLQQYDDIQLRNTGLKMILRHSWYLSDELATLCLFSKLIDNKQKSKLVSKIKEERSSQSHLQKKLPHTFDDLSISRSFFQTAQIDDSFLNVPIEKWSETSSYKNAAEFCKNLPCINDCAERGVALIQEFNNATKNEEQKQFLLQVIEMHRKKFTKFNRENLLHI